MKTLYKLSPYVLLICIALICFFSIGRNNGHTTTTDTIIIHDTISYSSIEYVPVPEYISYPVFDTVTEIDTVEVIKNHFAKVFYSDTLISDTTAFIAVYDTLYRNKIYSRRYDYSFYQKNTIINHYPPKWNFAVGAFIGANRNGMFIGPAGSVRKNQHSLSIGIDLLNDGGFVSYSLWLR